MEPPPSKIVIATSGEISGMAWAVEGFGFWLFVRLDVESEVSEDVGVGVTVRVIDGLGVEEGFSLVVGACVSVGVGDGVREGVGLCVGVGVGVSVGVGEGVGVGAMGVSGSGTSRMGR